MNITTLKILPIVFFFFTNIAAQVERESYNLKTATISVVGDIMCHTPQLVYSQTDDGGYNFNSSFNEIKKYVEKADFAIANFETVCGGESIKYQGYPTFNSPDTLIGALKYAGFDLLLTANNHILDMGINAAKRTMQQIEKRGLFYVGSSQYPEDRNYFRPIEVNGIKIIFLAYTQISNNGFLQNHEYILRKLDPDKVKSDIITAKLEKPDLIIVCYHFGTEDKNEPDSQQISIVKTTIEAGADIIIGGHPHRLQPIEFFKTNNASLDSGFVVYSMGNFISNQRWRYNDAGAILNFTIDKEVKSGKTQITSINFIPTWVFKGLRDTKKEFIIIPSEMAFSESIMSFLTEKDLTQMKESYSDCLKTFRKSSSKPYVLNLFNRIRVDNETFD